MATYIVDLPSKFAGVKVGPSIFVRDSKNELEVIVLCGGHPFQVVMTSELDAKK